MKRNILSMAVVATAMLMTSCGGNSVKLSPEAEQIFAQADGGLLTSEQLDILRLGVHRWELNSARHNAESIEQYAQLEQEEEEAQKKWAEAEKQLTGKTVATEVAEGVPAELLEPFTMKAGDNVIELLGKIKLTEDRPRVTDKNFHPADYYLIKLATIGADGQATDTVSLWSHLNNGVEHAIPAGTEMDVHTGIDVRIPEKSVSLLSAKKVRIIWEHPVQEKLPDIVRGDLGIFNLRGPVETCEWKGLYDTWKLYFNAEGQWVRENGRGTFNSFPTIQRDAQGRIVSMTNGDETLTYEYNADGLLKRHVAQYMDGGSESVYDYDANGDCVKEVSTYGGMDMEEDEDPTTVSVYTVTKRDEHNNWTERKDQHGQTERRIITYMP